MTLIERLRKPDMDIPRTAQEAADLIESQAARIAELEAAWVAGFDFYTRGFDSFMIFIATSGFTVMAYTFPGLKEKS